MMPMMTGSGLAAWGWGAGLGIIVVVALASIRRWSRAGSRPPSAAVDPLLTARERFARGDITREEFDQLVERLVKSEQRVP